MQNKSTDKDKKKEKKINKDLHKFLHLDYEKALDLLKMLQQHKLNYQKFYISLVGVVFTVSIGLINFASSKNAQVINILKLSISIEELVGLLLLLSFFVGYLILRNLASIRKSEVFFNNSILILRKKFIEELKLGKDYPNLEPVHALRRESADYYSIAICALINLFLLLASISFIFNNVEGFPGIIVTTALSILYTILYYVTIERYLGKNDI